MSLVIRVRWLLPILLGGWLTAWAPKVGAGRPSTLADELQTAADTSARHGETIVVLDVVSGAVLASRNMDVAAHRLARPGSTLKPFVLPQLLESGKLDAAARLLCRRPLEFGNKRMDCTHPAEIVTLDAADAIAYSCNSYVSEVATRLTAEELTQTLRRAGLDSRTGLAPDESTGHLARPSSPAELQLEALGDWGIETTPLELLAAYRGLALRARSGPLGVDAPVFAGLAGSVEYGTGDAAHVPGLHVAGKTGTAASAAQVQTHGFFVGFAPADQPQIVVVVYADRANGNDAAAVARSLFAAFARSTLR